jgi:hypothetical protein
MTAIASPEITDSTYKIEGTARLYPTIRMGKRHAYDEAPVNTGSYGIYGSSFLQNVDRLLAENEEFMFSDVELVDDSRGFFVKCTGHIALPIDSEASATLRVLEQSVFDSKREEGYARSRASEELSPAIAKIIQDAARRSGFTLVADFRGLSFSTVL